MSNDEMTPKPTIDTLLARLDEWGERIISELREIKLGYEELCRGQEDLHSGLKELRKGQDELRTDLHGGLRRVERKV